MAGSISGIDWVSRMPVSGVHTVTAAEASANKVEINTGMSGATGFVVQVVSSGKVATLDAALSIADGVLTVGDGTNYNTVENNVISWIVF